MQWQWGGIFFNGVYVFLMMCYISLLQRAAEDKEGRNYTVMQTVKPKRDTSCEMKERILLVSENSKIWDIYPHSWGLSTNKGPTVKPMKNFPIQSSSELFSIQPFYPLRQLFEQTRIILCFLSLFFSFLPDFIFPNVTFPRPSVQRK